MNMFLSGPMRKIANMGRMGDTELAHVTPRGEKTSEGHGRFWNYEPKDWDAWYFIA